MKSTRSLTEPFLLTEQQLAELVLDRVDAAILICDKQKQIVLANPAAQKLHGGDPVGLIFSEAFPIRWTQRENSKDGRGPFSLQPVLDGEILKGRGVLECDGQPPREILIHTAPYIGPQDDV
jgi:PAS domain-containing protein